MARCIEPAALNVEAVQALLKNKGTLGYESALRILSRLRDITTAAGTPLDDATIAAIQLERDLRQEIRSRAFDRLCMYRNPRAIFTGEGGPGSIVDSFRGCDRDCAHWEPRQPAEVIRAESGVGDASHSAQSVRTRQSRCALFAALHAASNSKALCLCLPPFVRTTQDLPLNRSTIESTSDAWTR